MYRVEEKEQLHFKKYIVCIECFLTYDLKKVNLNLKLTFKSTETHTTSTPFGCHFLGEAGIFPPWSWLLIPISWSWLSLAGVWWIFGARTLPKTADRNFFWLSLKPLSAILFSFLRTVGTWLDSYFPSRCSPCLFLALAVAVVGVVETGLRDSHFSIVPRRIASWEWWLLV